MFDKLKNQITSAPKTRTSVIATVALVSVLAVFDQVVKKQLNTPSEDN